MFFRKKKKGSVKLEDDQEPQEVSKSKSKRRDCVDIEGNKYKTIVVGDQEWMVENLRTTRYNNGDRLRHIHKKTNINTLVTNAWAYTEEGSWCYNPYVEESNNPGEDILYNYYAVMEGNLAPEGWRIPNEEDWNKLMSSLSDLGFQGKEGMALKSKNGWNVKKSVWDEDLEERVELVEEFNDNGKDILGWNAKPTGFREGCGRFGHCDKIGVWWSTGVKDSKFYNDVVPICYLIKGERESDAFIKYNEFGLEQTSQRVVDIDSIIELDLALPSNHPSGISGKWSERIDRFVVKKRFGCSIRCVRDIKN